MTFSVRADHTEQEGERPFGFQAVRASYAYTCEELSRRDGYVARQSGTATYPWPSRAVSCSSRCSTVAMPERRASKAPRDRYGARHPGSATSRHRDIFATRPSRNPSPAGKKVHVVFSGPNAPLLQDFLGARRRFAYPVFSAEISGGRFHIPLLFFRRGNAGSKRWVPPERFRGRLSYQINERRQL